MESNTAKFKKSDKMNVRDYITAAILYVLMFLVYAGVGAPIGMTVAGSLFVFAACAVVWGTIFMLLFTKVNKKGICRTDRPWLYYCGCRRREYSRHYCRPLSYVGRLVLPDSLRTRNAPSESKTSCSDQTSRRTKSYGRRCGLIRIFPFKLE